MKNKKYQNISVGKAGSGRIDLSTGTLEYQHEDTRSDSSILPTSVSHSYSSESAVNNSDTTFGKGFKLNLQQKLTHKDSDDSKWKYTDGSGTEHKFKERYYYLTTENGKNIRNYLKHENGKYKTSKDFCIRCDGRIFEVANPQAEEHDWQIVYEVFPEIRTQSGLALQTELKNFKGIEHFEIRHEELVKVEEEIKSLERNLDDIYFTLGKFSKMDDLNYKEFRKLQQDIEAANLELEKQIILNFKGQNFETPIEITQKSWSDLKITDSNDPNFVNQNNLSQAERQEYLSKIKEEYSKITKKLKLKDQPAINMLELNSVDFPNDVPTGEKWSYSDYDGEKAGRKYEQQITKSNFHNLKVMKSTDGSNENILANLRMYIWQENFNNSCEEIIQRINVFSNAIENTNWNHQKITMETRRKILVNQEKLLRKKLVIEIKRAEEDMDIAIRMLAQKLHTKQTLDNQLPVNYIVNNDIILGFNKQYEEDGVRKGGDLVAVFDNYGNQASIIYEDEKIVKVIDSDEKEIVFEYEKNEKGEKGKLLSITDFQDRKTTFEYHPQKPELLAKIIYPDGEYSTIGYTIDGLLSEILPPNGIGVVLDYNTNKKVTAVSAYSPTANPTTKDKYNISYPGTNSAKVTEEKTGSYVEYAFDTDGNVTSEKTTINGTVRQNIVTNYLTENDCEIVNVTSTDMYGRTNTSLVKYNNLRQVECEESTADTEKVVGESVEKLTVITSKEYNYSDNKLSKVKTIETIKNSSGTELSSKQTFVTYEYNKQGKPIRVTDSDDNVNETFYDKNGNVTKSCSYNKANPAAKFWSEKEVAENGQVLGEYDERGENKTSYNYLGGTNVVTGVTSPDGSQTSFAIDPYTEELLEMTAVANGENNSTAYTYEKGMLKSMKSGNTEISYEYDDWGRKKEILVNGIRYVSYNYQTDSETKNEITTATYVQEVDGEIVDGEKYITISDKFGKVLRVHYIDKEGIDKLYLENVYATDGYDNIDRVIDNKANTTTKYHYKNGVLIKVENGNINVTTVQDDHGNTTAIEYSGEIDQVYGYEYDEQNRLTETILPNDHRATMKYDGQGRITELNNPLVRDEIYYLQRGDHATNLVSSIYQHVGADTHRRKYTYDTIGNITHIHEDGQLLVRYKYDSLNRLVREDNAKINKSFTYEYDHNGNIIYKGIYDFSLKYLTNGNIIDYTYNGDRLTNNCEYDSLGNPIIYKGKSLTWNNLRDLSRFDNVHFEYNINGLRTKKTKSDTETKFYYTDNKLLAEKRSVSSEDLQLGDYLYEGEIYFTYTDKTDISYMYNANELTGFIYKTNTDEQSYYYRKNLQGDITHIYDSSGTLKAEYVYDAWGNHSIVTNEDNIANINPFRYRGYYYDVETGLYYLQSRYYDPETGRFINADEISMLDETQTDINGLNLYMYCGNNPITRIDPTGFGFFDWVGNLFSGMWEGFKSAVVGVWNTTKGLFTGETWVNLWNGVTSFFSDPLGSIVNFGNNLWSFGNNFISSLFSSDPYFAGYAIGSTVGTVATVAAVVVVATAVIKTVSFLMKNKILGVGRMNGLMKSGKSLDGYWGIRYKNHTTGKVYSIEIHPSHINHAIKPGIHLQKNQWYTTYAKYPGQYVLGKTIWRFRLW